jgi:transcriptional regulator with XRE-family HTH domain
MEMTGAELRAARKALDPILFEGHMRKREKGDRGPGRPPSGEVTQEALASYLGVSTATVQRWESGKVPVSSWVDRTLALLQTQQRTPAKKK